MSKARALLKEQLSKIDVTQALKVKSFAPVFETPPRSRLNAAHVPVVEHAAQPIPQLPNPKAMDIEQRVSNLDTVQTEQCPPLTVSNLDSVNNLHATVSKTDSVQNRHCTPSATRTIAPGFSMVPNHLLRSAGVFDEPLDFMVYLHLFTFSHGFHRAQADMSQAQLEQFTGAAKNTIKRSLERLVKRGWIKQVQEYQHSRYSRKWEVVVPSAPVAPDGNAPSTPARSATVSKMDTVQIEQCPKQTPTVSNLDTVTLSNFDTNKERFTNKASNNSLSPVPMITEYLSEVKPQAKRERETQAYRQLKTDYSDQQIAQVLAHLRELGLPSGEPCHSPMAYLAQAMEQVLALALATDEKARDAQVQIASQIDTQLRLREEELQAEREARERERVFLQEFSNPAEQNAVIAKFSRDLPFISAGGSVARRLAILAWWHEAEMKPRI